MRFRQSSNLRSREANWISLRSLPRSAVAPRSTEVPCVRACARSRARSLANAREEEEAYALVASFTRHALFREYTQRRWFVRGGRQSELLSRERDGESPPRESFKRGSSFLVYHFSFLSVEHDTALTIASSPIRSSRDRFRHRRRIQSWVTLIANRAVARREMLRSANSRRDRASSFDTRCITRPLWLPCARQMAGE